MKSFKVWLLRWLGAASEADLIDAIAVSTGDKLRLRDALYTKLHLEINDVSVLLDKLKAEQDASTAELIQELNNVRNSIPAAMTQSARPPVRVFRNFREFRTIMEGASKKIPIERNS